MILERSSSSRHRRGWIKTACCGLVMINFSTAWQQLPSTCRLSARLHKCSVLVSSKRVAQAVIQPSPALCKCSTLYASNNSVGKLQQRASLRSILESLAFPFYVLVAGAIGVVRPQTYGLLSDSFVTRALAVVMTLMGTTLSVEDFKRIATSWQAVMLGWCAQFAIMPLGALLVSRLYQLPRDLAAGVILVGCCPGGVASNLVTLLARADVGLSVTLTAFSTVTAGVMTPILTSALLGNLVAVDSSALVKSTLQVVLGPVLLGTLLNTFLLPRLPLWVKHRLNNSITPILSGLLVAAICGKVVAQNSGALAQAGLVLVASVVTLHLFGFLLGYLVSRLFGFGRRASRTVSIEVGMQNSALAVVLARNSLPQYPLAGLAGAVSATVHSVIGSILAYLWSNERNKEEEAWES